MPSREEVTYFGAGPALLPTPVLESAARSLLNHESTGLGLAEHSHRSTLANNILEDTRSNLRALLDVPESYDVLFMQGGGSGEFSAVVYNLVGVWVERRRLSAEKEIRASGKWETEQELEELVMERLKREVTTDLKLDYLVTGSWSLKASQEAARLLGPEHVHVAVDARQGHSGKFLGIPDESSWNLTPTRRNGGSGSAFVYYCDNETVDGVEFPSFPKILEAEGSDEDEERLIVADMSSNILSRPVDVKKFAVIFAGAQKNVGTTGLTLMIIRKSLLPPFTLSPAPAILRALNLPNGPIILDYATIAKNKSLYNTLSIFDVWIAGQVMGSLLSRFGDERVAGMERLANSKAKLLYSVLDKWPSKYQVVPDRAARSRMNICFRVLEGDAGAEAAWLQGAEKQGLLGLKGHRSVGGIRCSNYNSISMEDAQKLARYLEEFAQKQVEE